MVKFDGYMKEALKEAACALREDEVPVGAVITCKGKIIARGHNQVERLKDPTAHAEMIAITKASFHLRSKFLDNCTLFVTIEPCSMCAGALVLSRLYRVVYGADDPKTGALGSKLDINSLKLNHKFEVKKGVLAVEATSLMREFFTGKRSKV
ncbi:MAG: tRNA-specific adenosine deaminase [Candidatus Omnitrophica bacterium]|nr:tRNA-specific adenosine deaminase [Candidatus Omnitrophota bacterium]MBD3268771.1 tRNA-specific adenosine deaminase [Candidatus Omnitrophota bacterium]